MLYGAKSAGNQTWRTEQTVWLFILTGYHLLAFIYLSSSGQHLRERHKYHTNGIEPPEFNFVHTRLARNHKTWIWIKWSFLSKNEISPGKLRYEVDRRMSVGPACLTYLHSPWLTMLIIHRELWATLTHAKRTFWVCVLTKKYFCLSQGHCF